MLLVLKMKCVTRFVRGKVVAIESSSVAYAVRALVERGGTIVYPAMAQKVYRLTVGRAEGLTLSFLLVIFCRQVWHYFIVSVGIVDVIFICIDSDNLRYIFVRMR